MRKAHWAIEKVTSDIDGRFAFNTAIAAVMELVNEASSPKCAPSREAGAMRFALATAASLLFPFAPHVSADAYELMTGRRVWEEPWPASDAALLETDTFELVCQVNGKVRDRVQVPADATPDELKRSRASAQHAGPHRRQRGRQGDRRAGQARQRRRALTRRGGAP